MVGLFPLRPLQQTALDALKSSILAGKRRIVVQAPTGFGKTVIGAHMAAGALRKNNRCAFVVPQINLIDQTFERFVANGIDPGDMGVLQADHPWRRPHAPLQLCSIKTLAARGFPEVKFAIIDECHMREKSLDKWMQDRQDVIFFGLSATPWSRGMGDVWDDLVIPTTLSDLIDLGWLSKFRVFAAANKVDLRGVKTVAGEFHEGQLAEVMGNKTIVADVVSTWLEKGEGRPTICFAVNRAHASELHDQFHLAGVGVAYIDGLTPREERQGILERYRRGEVTVICSVLTMTTGVDIPCRCIIDAAPTQSEIRHVQKIGRGLRTEDGKADLIVLDHAGNCQRLGMPTSIGRTSLRTAATDAKERARDEDRFKEPLPRECACCHALMPAKTRVCPACGAEMKRRSDVETVDGELVEVGTEPKKGKLTAIERLQKQGKQSVYSQLWELKGDRADGWAAHKYRAIFSCWPKNLIRAPLATTPELQSWLHAERIRWAKSKQNSRNAGSATADDTRGLVDAV